MGDHRMRGNELVLLVVDDTTRAGALARALQYEEMAPVPAFTSKQALACLGPHDFRVVVVALSLRSRLLRTLLANVQERSRAPLIVLSNEPSLAVAGIADCVLPERTPDDDVAARARALLTIVASPQLPARLSWGPLELDLGRRLTRWYLDPLHLTSIQFRIMEVLVLAAGSMVTARELARRVWGSAIAQDEDRIRAHIWRIRKLVEARPSSPEFLLTVRGEGFRLADYEIHEPDVDLREFSDTDAVGSIGNGASSALPKPDARV